MSKPTLIKWAQDNTTARDIHNLHALFIDELQEKHRIGKQHRLEFFGDVFSKAKEELATRDFSDIPTDKLIALILKTSSAIKADEQQLVIKGDREFGLFELSHDKTWKV